ncbi:hypothetical protein FA95DRAFT_715037 [Auriscalpium vulgare]|uniref:Uncharacterized protein n=1 Tax=Auriscalpium vulgare TaxID=40419 RepID=A0ACB8RB97_9AGAM|nr:hypothetical protein FA95DRAFT_715037 [Auriscalpium vulgare]
MCSSCDQSQPHTFKMPNGQVHKSWHATLVVTRPVIREEANLRRPFIPLVLDGLMGLTAENVREEKSDNATFSSSDSDGDDDSDGGRSPRYDPDESAVPLVVEPLAVSPLQVGKDKFTCSNCSQVLTGTRFVYSPEGGGLAMCPDCERNTRAAFCEVGALPAEYHIMFRLILPLPEDSTVEVERQEVASAEQETVQLRKSVEEMGTRLAAMEARFSNVEYKLDTLLRLLS